MVHMNLVIMAPIRARMNPVDGLKELASLHKSLVQMQIPVAIPQSNSMSAVPHDLAVSAGLS